jgi:hypothetical protein
MKPPKEKKITTQSELATKLGVARQLISYHRKKPGAPKLNDLEAWREFLIAEGRDSGLPPELRRQLAKERLRLIREQADKLEDEKALRRREVINFNLVRQFIRDLVANCFFSELERLSNEFPVSLKGCDELAIKKECDRQIAVIVEKLKKKLREMESVAEKK